MSVFHSIFHGQHMDRACVSVIGAYRTVQYELGLFDLTKLWPHSPGTAIR
jgi:hypothetical protein